MANFLKKLFLGGNDENEKESKSNKDFEIFKYDGVRATRIGKFDYAEKCFLKALEINKDFETMHYLTTLYMNTANFERAAEALKEMIETDPSVVSSYITLAQVYYIMEKYQDMQLPCNNALDIDKENADALLLLAKSNVKLGNLFDAIAFATRSIESKENNTDALLSRAEILHGMKQYSEALKDVEAILAYDNQNESAQIEKAEILGEEGKTEEALKIFDQVNEENPFNMEAYISKARLYMAINEAPKAIDILTEAIELSPDYSATYRERGRARLMNGDKEGATEDVKKALELSPAEASKINGEFNNKAAEFDNIIGIFK